MAAAGTVNVPVTYRPDDELPESLSSWRDGKIVDLSYCLATFFNYLAAPRPGYAPVEVASEVDVGTVRPVISMEMAKYLIGEIFPCEVMGVEQGPIPKVSDAIDAALLRRIKKGVENKSFLVAPKTGKKSKKEENREAMVDRYNKKNHLPGAGSAPPSDLKINPGVTQLLWTYIANGMLSLTSGLDKVQDDRELNSLVKERIEANEVSTLARRNAIRNYGFNDDMENSAFQAILYIIVALVDWLEAEQVTELEVETAYRIIVPKDLQKDLRKVADVKSSDIITGAIVSQNLIPSEEAVQMIAGFMREISGYMKSLDEKNSRRVMNRLMAFCQPV
jgi:hypothetical protein